MLVSFELSISNIILLGFIGFLVRKAYDILKKYRMMKKLETWDKKTKGDTVILHGISRAKTTPNFSPFVLKLETFLKAAKIPYQFDSTDMFGPKEKIPWISYDGQHMGDSHLIIQFLKKKFNNATFGQKYSDAQRAMARSARIMMEEHFFWGYASWIWIDGFEQSRRIMNGNPIVLRIYGFFASRGIRKIMWSQGLGRHTRDEFMEMMLDDLRSISDIMGKNKFLLGDEVCEEDFAIFGMLANCLWAIPGSPYEKLMTGELINLKEYCVRMKEEFWPDWDQCLGNKNALEPGASLYYAIAEMFFKKI